MHAHMHIHIYVIREKNGRKINQMLVVFSSGYWKCRYFVFSLHFFVFSLFSSMKYFY